MSIIDYKRKTLAPTVWEGDKLMPSVRAFLVSLINKFFPGNIGYYILGSITTRRWTDASDVDLCIVYSDKTSIKPLGKMAAKLTSKGIHLQGSPHTVGFYVSKKKDMPEYIRKSVGAYNMLQNKWEKLPDDTRADTDSAEALFHEKVKLIDKWNNELKRDRMDVSMMRRIYDSVDDSEKEELKRDLKRKEGEVKKDLSELRKQFRIVESSRKDAFKRSTRDDFNEIDKHKLNQTMPENVIFKMLERYNYRKLLEELK